MKNIYPALLVFLACLIGCQPAQAPDPVGATPSTNHLRWHALEYYAFVHFSMNTFTNEEWGHGTESPETFQPTALDCRQWARICRDAGMKGIILTAKHHDGFCLWPSAYSTHTVAQSPWRDGKGDVLRELSAACQEYGLLMGVYLSPWDRNHPAYGTDAYNEVFKNTLREVLTQYGSVFEVWFDGANGEGPNGKKQVYDFPGFIQVVRETQPGAVIFSDAGPDIRWVGNEQGFASDTNWHTLNRDDYFPGTPRYRELTQGNPGGTHWVPSECDVSIRPGWYYHADQDTAVKTLEHLSRIWYGSVGNGSNLLLNIPVDRRGLIHPADSARLMAFKQWRDQRFSTDLAQGRPVTASATRGRGYEADRLTDGQVATCWAAPDGVTTATLEVSLPRPTPVAHVRLEEYIALGQRITSFKVLAHVPGSTGDGWQEVGKGATIGAQRIVAFEPVTADQIRIEISSALAPPVLAALKVFQAP
ncbi:MAG: alpha-L-fucosidase [Bacteroidia bacterium]|nr:alpha-L-fucosidase [Bacteroidia bacterium]